MAYDYLAINFTSVAGFIFLLIFLHANASLDPKIRRIFYRMILLEFVEMLVYSLELWTTTFETLTPLRLWFSAVGYSVRPFIFCLMLMLATRHTTLKQFHKWFYIPAIVNVIAAFSVFFTDIVYSYTPDNVFHRGPLGFITHMVVILYLILLTVEVFRSHAGRRKLEMLIIFAISVLLVFAMVVEAAFKVRTVGRASIVLVTVFYYMFFQTQVHKASLSKEQSVRQQLEEANRIDGSTGVLNKKAFTHMAKQILTSNNHKSLGFVFLDLDHLKKLNDTLGHAVGDIAIAESADTIQAVYRKSDLIGRFGGDEFYILLPDIPRHRFQVCLNDLQAGLQKEYESNGLTVAVTASIGAVFAERAHGVTFEQLVNTADEALYAAKAAGRNCHVIREI